MVGLAQMRPCLDIDRQWYQIGSFRLSINTYLTEAVVDLKTVPGNHHRHRHRHRQE